MSKLSSVFLLAGLLSAAAAAQGGSKVEFNPEPKSPRIIKVGESPKTILCKDGAAQLEIVCTDTNAIARRAASELANYLGKMLGAKLKVVRQAGGKVPAIYVGQSEAARKAGLDPSKLEGDGYYIKTVGKDICIIGIDRTERYHTLSGTLFGVYEFLERFCGARFYFPGPGTILPKHKNLSVPEIDITDRPDSMMRFAHILDLSKRLQIGIPGFFDSGLPADQRQKMRYLWRFSELLPHIPHGMGLLELPKRFGKSHPEYFALVQGYRQNGDKPWIHFDSRRGYPCFSSEGLKNELYLDCETALLGKDPATRNLTKLGGYCFTPPMVAINPGDGLLLCECPECSRFKTPQEQSTLIWRFMMDIARRLQQNKVPGYFGMCAYEQFAPVPDGSVEIPSNVIVQLCAGSPWVEKSEKLASWYADLLGGWYKRLGKKPFIWVYPTKMSAMVAAIPNVAPHTAGKFLKRHASKIRGYFWEAENDRWLYSALDTYVMSRLSWNNSLDPEAVLDEYYRTMFGPAAAPMKEFYGILETNWLKILSDTRNTSYGPKWNLKSEYEIWNTIYTQEEMARAEKLLAEAARLTASDKAALERVKYMRKYLWEPVVNTRKKFLAQQDFGKLAQLAVPESKVVVKLDGKLNEPSWRKAPFAALITADRKPTEVNTKVSILQDRDYFYFGVEAEEPQTAKMIANCTKEDDGVTWRDNGMEFFFAPAADSNFFYQFMLNFKNVKSDMRWNEDGKMNLEWNSGWETCVSVEEGKKWTAEIKIPKKSMPELSGRDSFMLKLQRHRALEEDAGKVIDYYFWRNGKNSKPCDFGIIWNDPAQKAPRNLIPDGDFLTAPWVRKQKTAFIGKWHSQNRNLFRDEHIFLTGGGSVRLQKECARIRREVSMLEPNKRYKLSFFVKLENVEKKSAFYPVIYWGAKHFQPHDRPSGTMPWTHYEYEFTVPEKRQYSILEFNIRGTKTGKAWLDHVEIFEVEK